MGDTVVSEFSSMFWVKGVVLSIIYWGILIIYDTVVYVHRDNYSTVELVVTGLVSVFAIGIYIKLVTDSYIQLTIAREGLCITYLLTKKEIVIDYTDITHVSSIIANSRDDKVSARRYLKLKIELSTGEKFSFSEDQFNNYHELKDAIRRFRFNLE